MKEFTVSLRVPVAAESEAAALVAAMLLYRELATFFTMPVHAEDNSFVILGMNPDDAVTNATVG